MSPLMARIVVVVVLVVARILGMFILTLTSALRLRADDKWQ